MKEIAYAKVNLFLDVLHKRPDGYHDIGTLFQTISIHDTLEFFAANSVRVTYNPPADIPVTNCLVTRAAIALQEYTGCTMGAHIVVTKVLPMGAGLGGGSSDCAAALRGLNQLWGLELTNAQLEQIGAKLGADVPFFISGGTQLAQGIGEQLHPIHVEVPFYLIVVTPHEFVATALAYSHVKPIGGDRYAAFKQYVLQQQATGVLDVLVPGFDLYNVFEQSVFLEYPLVKECYEHLITLGCDTVLLSGSGASVLGFCREERQTKEILQKISTKYRFSALATPIL